MSFWDKFKSFFGAAPPRDLGELVKETLAQKLKAGLPFTSLDVAEETRGGTASPEDYMLVVHTLDAEFRNGGMPGWTRHLSGDSYVYSKDEVRQNAAPAGGVPLAPVVPLPTARPQPPRENVQPKPTENPYRASDILGLGADELRKRALKMRPWMSAWARRGWVIPPLTDEITAIIDRSMVLRGHITEDKLLEIHKIGDEWLRHHEAVKIASSVAARGAKEAIDDLKKRKAEEKARKKQEAAERRAKRAEEIARRRAEDIIHLGAGVSGKLADRRGDLEKLKAFGLPILSTPAEIASALNLKIPRLRWLCYHSEAVTKMHYVCFEVPKRSGGTRLLSSPRKELAAAQKWILENILEKLTAEPPAHGFLRGRSTVTNATPHLGRDVVVNLDLSDFFPTITFPRVRGLFQKLGYSPAAATILALLCTESPRRAVEMDGKIWFVAVGERSLPQGACTSPALSNQIARRLDKRLAGMAQKHGWTYTRYADDLTFSSDKIADAPMLMARVRHIVDEEGFSVNPKKGRVQRSSGRQTVTGVVVNEKPSLPRVEIRKLRAILHNAKKSGLAAQNKENHPHFESWLRGKLAYLQMVDRSRGQAMLKELDDLLS